ncbi:methionine--tRNA ligase [Nitratidesulfovibrio sp. 1201_IL3209]|uniref:methionine--tRNA ligase n=1 Tax=Nitratidesulfovibrio sp. 1201_IL3209 TaxID=3084053 RepID=UPI002FDB2C26
MDRFYITTPIYYVNAKPHLGHAYTTIVADSLRRFHRLLGKDTYFLTGTDEHGDKIVQAAEKAGCSPQEFVDGVSTQFRDLWPHLGVEYDQFIRTTDPVHKKCVQDVLQKVHDSGDIYFGEYGGHYCYGCERFYTEKELENGLCPQHQVKPEYISEKNYFFRMSKYQDWLRQYILDNPDFIRPERYRSEVLGILDSGALEDLCISRPKSRLTWGIELPFDTEYVCYVWFDALINYISALGWPDGEKFGRFWPGVQHLVAKDILKPHAVFWPTMLKAAGLEPYNNLNVHGYWLVRDTKMSKSLGNVVDPLSMIDKYGLSAFRYFLLREMHFGSDASFSEDALVARLNADLANDLGNLFSRVLSMTAKYFGGVVPAQGPLTENDEAIRTLAEEAQRNFVRLFERVRFSNALESLWELVRALNRYVDHAAPWALFKQGDTERLGTVMYVMLECMRKVAVHLWPVMPEASGVLLGQLGQTLDPASVKLAEEADRWGGLAAGTTVAASSNLFPRVELEKPEAARPDKSAKPEKGAEGKKKDKAAAPPAQAAAPAAISAAGDVPATIEFADFQKLDIRFGTVLVVERHPNADKLYRVEVDLGEAAPRQIVAGLAEYFEPDFLLGRQVAVVVNLAPRKLRGLESQGMILAVRTDGGMQLVAASGPVANGAKVS